MKRHYLSSKTVFSFSAIILFTLLLALSARAEEYQALKGIQQVKAVFDVSLKSPTAAPVVFWAVKNVYEAESVRNLPQPPQAAVVFHGQAVRLISSDRENFTSKEKSALDEFAEMLREMKKDGVQLEVCMYAVKVLGIDPDTILPEIDKVGNGFISVVGYQQQGYSVVTIK